MPVPSDDRSLLRRLAERVAEIAALPVHRQTAAEWRRLNRLEPGRPLVWINEIPWHEMNVDDELTLGCADPFCRGVEWQLRALIYQWEHMPGDMVVDPVFYSPLVIHDSGFGIQVDASVIHQHERGGINSWDYRPQIQSEEDLDKIHTPEIRHDEEASERNFEALHDLFGDILPIKKRGVVHTWFAPWDVLVMWWGVQEALTDLAVRPELVHAGMERLVDAHLERLRQWEELGLLDQTDGNYRVGSGGLGYTDELPQPDADRDHIRSIDQWGCATAQIFSEVSPAMHEEFALRYERHWLQRFGLNYYGCCEQLHHKLPVLASIPNLRKISMSPRADVAKAAPLMAGRYVMSRKPNPAVLASDVWNPEQARRELMDALEKAEGCVVEIIMKDISTVRDEPQRLWEWETIARDVAARFV